MGFMTLERRGSLNKFPRYILLQSVCYSLTGVIFPHVTLTTNPLNTKYYINNVMGIDMMDASHCLMSYVAVVLTHDITLQRNVSEKVLEALV